MKKEAVPFLIVPILMFLLVLITPFGCTDKHKEETASAIIEIAQPHSSVPKAQCDSLLFNADLEKAALRDSCRILLFAQRQKYQVIVDSLANTIQLKNSTIGAVRKYYKICVANPKQDVFLKGWISRALMGDK